MDKINWHNKKVWYVLGAVVIVIALIFSFGGHGGEVAEELVDKTSNEGATANTPGEDDPSQTQSSTIKSTTPSLTYQQAINKYGDRRVQFDANCQARPNSMTYKSGAEIMLDNRSNVSRKIKIASTYTIPAYGFKIVKITASTFPTTYLVDCGASQNVATIIVQK